MKRNLKKKLLSLAMTITLITQLGFLSSASAQEISLDENTAVTPYSAGIIYRLAFFGYMNNRVIPGDIAHGELTSLSVKTHDSNGLEAYEFNGEFSGKKAGISQSYTISLISGNKAFWTAVINHPTFELSQAGDFFLGLAQIISSYFVEGAAISDFTNAFVSVSDKATLKVHLKSMDEDDFLVLVPQFTVYQRLWNFFILDSTVPTNSFVIDAESDIPDVIPDWVYNGPPVTIL